MGTRAALGTIWVWLALGSAGLLVPGAPVQAQGAAAGPAGAAPAAQVMTAPIRAFLPDGTTLVYRGQYRGEQRGAQIREVQEYASLQGAPVQRVETLYDLEHMQPLFYDSQDLRSGARARITWDAAGLHYETWKSKDEPGPTGTESDRTLIVWPNMVHVVAKQWDVLASGKPMVFGLYVASRRMSVVVNVASIPMPEGGDATGIERFKVEPDSWILRKLSSGVHLDISRREPHQVLRFQSGGIIATDEGKSQDLLFVFDWPKAP